MHSNELRPNRYARLRLINTARVLQIPNPVTSDLIKHQPYSYAEQSQVRLVASLQETLDHATPVLIASPCYGNQAYLVA